MLVASIFFHKVRVRCPCLPTCKRARRVAASKTLGLTNKTGGVFGRKMSLAVYSDSFACLSVGGLLTGHPRKELEEGFLALVPCP